MPANIKTTHVYPPIPIRTSDWCATRGNYDLGCRVGWGSTEAEAIADLLELEDADRED